MKTVYLTRDFVYRPHWKRHVLFRRGITYRRVLEAAARSIESADAGRIITDDDVMMFGSMDAYHAWHRRG